MMKLKINKTYTKKSQYQKLKIKIKENEVELPTTKMGEPVTFQGGERGKKKSTNDKLNN